MKLFDYKFLILLGLTLVVYFLYRELNDIKKRVKDLENKNYDVKIIEDKNENNLVDFKIPLPPKKEEDLILTKSPEKFKNVNEEIIHLNHNEVEETSDYENVDDQMIEQIAIYSNDNENERTNSYSLGESSELIEESNASVEEIIESEKKKNILVKSEGDDEIDLFIENKDEVKIDVYTNSEFLKYKLNELQCFAEEYKIDIKNNDKKGKKKTKVELANDLVEHFKKQKNNLKNP